MPQDPKSLQAQQPTAARVIPPHPLQAARAAAPGNGAQPPAPAPTTQSDWFARAGDSSDEVIVPPEPITPSAPPAAPPLQQQPDDIEALLRDIGEPEPLAPQAPQMPEPQPTAQPQQPQPMAPPAPSTDPTAQRKQAIDYLMANEYRMDDTMARRLISEPEAVLPEIAARVHVNIMGDLGRRVGELLPTMVDALVQQRLGAHSAELEFFGQYPQLNRPEFRPIVAQSLAFVRQSNPEMDRATLMREGAMLSAYRIKGMRRQAAPPVPPTRAPVNPYVPVAPGGGAPVPMRPQDDNVWAQLASDPNLFDF